MITIALPMASPTLLKRMYDATDLQYPGNSPQNGTGVTEGLPCLLEPTTSKDPLRSQFEIPEAEHNRQNSLVPSSSGSAAGDATIQAITTTTSTKPASKRQKLTDAEQETKRLEKEIKDRQKANEKTKKEDDKRARDIEKEEKRKLKEAQNKLREDERKKREKEKNKREEEKNKKEKACDCVSQGDSC